MKQARWLVVLAIVFLGVVPMRADSSPAIAGSVHMIELCPQSVCGVAIFVGVFQGRVGINPRAIGTVAVVVNHNALPTLEGQCTDITRGAWGLQTLGRGVSGGAVGYLCATTDNPLTFDVHVAMSVTSGGSGAIGFSGLLDHRPFPPTLIGNLF